MFLDLYDEKTLPPPADWESSFEGKPRAYREDYRFVADRYELDEMRRIMAHYFALISHVDDQIGRVFRTLDGLGLKENTLVAFISDHGEMLGEHGLLTKRYMYEGSVRVPCLLWWPGRLPSGKTVREPFAGVDLAPTLLELAGVPALEPMHGRSFAAAAQGGAGPAANEVVAEVCAIRGERELGKEALAATAMLRRERWKLIRHREYGDELYDLETDPGERANLAAGPDGPPAYVALRRRLADLLRRQGPGPYDWAASNAGW